MKKCSKNYMYIMAFLFVFSSINYIYSMNCITLIRKGKNIEEYISPDTINKIKREPRHGIICLNSAIRHKNMDSFRFLLSLGLDVNKSDGFPGDYPIAVAARANNIEALNLLLQAGANMNIPDRNIYEDGIERYETTALHEAIEAGALEAVKFLLNHGADTTIKNREDMTPLELVQDKLDLKENYKKIPIYEQIYELLKSSYGEDISNLFE